MLTRLFAALLIVLSAPTFAQTASVESPGKVLTATISLNGEGRAQYRIDRLGKPVLADSQLGFLFTDQPQMLRNFEIVGRRTRDHDETWTTPWGEDRTIRDRYRELVVDFHLFRGTFDYQTRRQRILLLSRQLRMQSLHGEGHRDRGDETGNRTFYQSVHEVILAASERSCLNSRIQKVTWPAPCA